MSTASATTFDTAIPTKCHSTSTEDNKIITVTSGEICTIETAKQYGIFGESTYFNTFLSQSDAESIDILTNNMANPNSKYALCSIKTNKHTNDTAFKNCVLSTQNPWKTLHVDFNTSNEKCMLPFNITLPSVLNYNKDESTNIDKPMKIAIWKSKRDYCQEKWYDWFSIPDYHLGNKFSLSSNLQKCLQPCQIGFVPSVENPDKCVIKSDYDDGYFANTFNYLPIALIVLLGSTSQTLLSKYKDLMQTSNLEKNKDIYIDNILHSYITSDAKALNNIYTDIKTDLRYNINNLMQLPFDEKNIVAPFFKADRIPVNPITKSRILDAYNIAQTFYELSTAKDPTNYNKWKQQLLDINGYKMQDTKFYKQLLTLKAACNIAFGGNNLTDSNNRMYSEEYILYMLNEGASDKDVKPPIFFTISEQDKIAAISKNSAENAVLTDNKTMKKQTQIINNDRRQLAKINEDKIELTNPDLNVNKYDLEKPVDNSKKPKSIFTFKNLIITFIFILLMIVFGSVIYIIVSSLWTPISKLLNTIILALYKFNMILADAFKGKYTASTLNRDIVELQQKFVSNIIQTDKNKYKIID